MPTLPIFDEAESNEDGDLVVERQGQLGTFEVNLSKMFRPGKRKTSNVQTLLIEARQAERTSDEDRNYAFPANSEIADEALDRMDEEGLEPAWLHGPSDGEY